MTELTHAIRREREALIGLLSTLTPQEWSAASLCAGWTVRDVAAHLAWAADLSPREGLAELVRARGRPNELVAGSARRWSRRGSTAILAQLRAVAERVGSRSAC